MKTYTRDEIKRIMIDRPELVFKIGSIELKCTHTGMLLSRVSGAVKWTTDYCLSWFDGYTIPADNEKPAELPESVKREVRNLVDRSSSGDCVEAIAKALWAETVKLVEASKK